MAAGFGGFGTFGGQRNTSFPMRQNPPQERVVTDPFAGMNGASGWETDWQNRFNEEAAREGEGASAGTPGTLVGQQFDNAGYLAANQDVTNQANWQPEVGAAVFGSNLPIGALHYGAWGQNENRSGVNFDANAYLTRNPDVAQAVNAGQFSSAQDHFAKFGWNEGRDVAQTYIPGSPGSPGYTPDFTGLNAEKDRLQPMAQNQIRQQQSFDMMNGWGQENAVMGDDYTAAGFGQVSGETNPYGADMGQAAFDLSGGNDGISTDWLSGVYDPQQGQAAGVYRPQQNNAMGGWGL
jgi:hypothetical protein